MADINGYHCVHISVAHSLLTLTEYDLLAIQSPSYCRNVFRTPILIKVVQEGEMVSLKFKTVADVNRFLFNKSGSKTIRSLG